MKQGFTIVELLIIIGISVVLLSFGFSFYNRAAERQLILFREQNKLVSALDKAKYLALSTFGQEQAPCGFGINLNASNNTIIIFKELPVSGNDCANIDYVYTPAGSSAGGDEIVETIQLDQAVRFNNLMLNNVVFIPPAPQITVNGDPSVQSASAEIVDFGGTTASSVTIAKTGQMTVQSGLTPTMGGGQQQQQPQPIQNTRPSGPSIIQRIFQWISP